MSNRRKRPGLPHPESLHVPRPRAQGPKFGEIAAAMASAATDGTIPRRPFVAPQLPPGVGRGRPAIAMDSQTVANYGWLNGMPGYCGLGFPGYPYLAELAQRSEYRAPTEVIASELTREWVKFTGADEKKLKELEQAFEDFGVQAAFRTLAQYDGFFGRGQLYISIKGQESDKGRLLPLIVDDKGATIQKGALLGIRPIEPVWTTPYLYNSIDPTDAGFYKPEWWYVMGKQTHSTRLLTFVSRPLPDILKPAYNFGGMSLTQLIEPYVSRWLKGVDSVSRMVTNYSTSGILTDMQASLQTGMTDPQSLFRRIQVFNQMRDNRGVLMLDKDSEEFFQFNTPLSGLADLLAQLQEHMAAPTHIPLVKLTGVTPAGLNANSDGEIKVFYDFIAAEQENLFEAHLKTVLRIVQLHLWGTVDEGIKFEWVPLDSPTDKELSEMATARASAGAAYVSGGIISPDEERERLRNDPHSGYTHIEGDAPTAPLDDQKDESEDDTDHSVNVAADEWEENKHPRQEDGKFGTGGSANKSATFKNASLDDPAFKKWFKGSKVKNKDGSPIIVFHGSPKEFESFDPSKRQDYREQSAAGVWFSSTQDTARTYGQHLKAAALNIKKPYVFEMTGSVVKNANGAYAIRVYDPVLGGGYLSGTPEFKTKAEAEAALKEAQDDGRLNPTEKMMARAIKEAKENGHDGIVFRNIDDTLHGERKVSDVYAVFDESQIAVLGDTDTKVEKS